MPDDIEPDWDTGFWVDTRDGAPRLYHIRSRCEIGSRIPVSARRHSFDVHTLGHVRECLECGHPSAQPFHDEETMD